MEILGGCDSFDTRGQENVLGFLIAVEDLLRPGVPVLIVENPSL